MNSRASQFWAKVLFKDFIRHYRKMNDEQIAADVKQSMDDIEDLNEDGSSFGAKMVCWASQRISNNKAQRIEAGRKGGNAKAANERAKAAKNNDQVTASDISANGSQLDAASGNAADDCKVPPSGNNLVADGDTREGSLNFANTGNRAHLESGTSAATNFSPEEAPAGNDGDEHQPAECSSHLLNADGRASESATSSGQNNSVRGSAKPACGRETGRKLPPPTKEAVYDFARTAKLDADDAREWFEINFVDRPGCDKDGIVIENWKGHCKNYCKAKAKRRKL